jgi:hypothetical protein
MMRAMAVPFPHRNIGALQELATRLLDARKTRTDLAVLARDLLLGFYDVCTYGGLDRVLAELASELTLDVSDRAALADHEPLARALVAQLETANLDGGGPRNVRPRQLAECVVAALQLTVAEEPDRSVTLGDDVRTAVVAAIASVVDVELAAPKIREAIIADAQARTEERAHASFGKIVAQLDERGLQLVKTPKVPLDALHAVQRALNDARNAVIERVTSAAIDRVQAVIGSADADAAARLDRPITLRSTPREVAILRARDPRAGKTPSFVAQSLLASVTELVPITWRAPEQKVQSYAANRTFAVGELIEHPKFGRGKVISGMANRIEVEFPDGKHTLVHVPPRR